jgi:hypothetical protein
MIYLLFLSSCELTQLGVLVRTGIRIKPLGLGFKRASRISSILSFISSIWYNGIHLLAISQIIGYQLNSAKIWTLGFLIWDEKNRFWNA